MWMGEEGRGQGQGAGGNFVTRSFIFHPFHYSLAPSPLILNKLLHLYRRIFWLPLGDRLTSKEI